MFSQLGRRSWGAFPERGFGLAWRCHPVFGRCLISARRASSRWLPCPVCHEESLLVGSGGVPRSFPYVRMSCRAGAVGLLRIWQVH